MFVILDQIAHYICRQTGARTGNRKWTGLEWRRKTTTRLPFEIIWWARTSVYRSLPSYVYSHWVMLKHNVSKYSFWILRYFYLVYRCANGESGNELHLLISWIYRIEFDTYIKHCFVLTTVHVVLSYFIYDSVFNLSAKQLQVCIHRCDFPSITLFWFCWYSTDLPYLLKCLQYDKLSVIWCCCKNFFIYVVSLC